MLVKMLASMAGAAFSYQPGDVVPVDDAHAEAWIAAGLAEAAPPSTKGLTAEIEELAGQNEDLHAQLAESDRLRLELAGKLETAEAAVADLTGKLAAAVATPPRR